MTLRLGRHSFSMEGEDELIDPQEAIDAIITNKDEVVEALQSLTVEYSGRADAIDEDDLQDLEGTFTFISPVDRHALVLPELHVDHRNEEGGKQSQEIQDLMLRNPQDRWKMSYSRYLIRMETISDYDIKMMKTITNAIHRNVKNYLEPHERYKKAIVEKNPGEILSCIATLLHSTMISHSTTAVGIAALCKQFAIQHQKADESVEVFYEKWKSMGITVALTLY